MNQSLGYLREFLAEYAENEAIGKKIYNKLSADITEEQFAGSLSQKESKYLNQVLIKAIEYSKQEQDRERVQQLNEVYEQIFI